MSKKNNNFGNAISLDDDEEINTVELADKALDSRNNANYERFKEGNLRKEVSKILTVKTTQYQFDIIQQLAKAQNKTIKDLFLNYVAEEARKEGIL